MTVTLDLLEAMRRAGVDAARQLVIIEAMLTIRAERRLARRAAVTTTLMARSHMNDHDSDGMVGKADVEPQRRGHVGNGNHKTVARAALLAHPKLRPAARLVGARLVEHADIVQGLCWPSIGRMARQTGLSERSVSRAVAELRAAGLVDVVVHGGQSHANAYKLAGAALGIGAAKMNAHDSGATTTLVSADHDSRVVEIQSQNPEQGFEVKARRGHKRRRAVLQRQLPLMVVHQGGADISASKGSASYGQAGQRLWDDMGRHADVAVRRQLLDLVDRQPAVLERATFAELRSPGSGLGVLLVAAQGPPASATG